jgi:bifunctional NMN adenylyltransferase/nudix hydrolase
MANVVIGRFQPFTDAHRDVIKTAINDAHTKVIVGSVNEARSFCNPFTFEERTRMLNSEFHGELEILPLEDSHYNYEDWKRRLCELKNPGDTVYGHLKDTSSFYLKDVNFKEVGNQREGLNATEVRKHFFGFTLDRSIDMIAEYCPASTLIILTNWTEQEPQAYKHLCEEFLVLKKFHALHDFNCTFATADAIITCEDKVLLCKKQQHPGLGLLSFPSDILRWEDTSLLECMYRTVYDQTTLNLKSFPNIIDDPVIFDSPWRDSRGRVISHVYRISLMEEKDLWPFSNTTASWYELNDLRQNQFYCDHYHILRKLLG